MIVTLRFLERGPMRLDSVESVKLFRLDGLPWRDGETFSAARAGLRLTLVDDDLPLEVPCESLVSASLARSARIGATFVFQRDLEKGLLL